MVTVAVHPGLGMDPVIPVVAVAAVTTVVAVVTGAAVVAAAITRLQAPRVLTVVPVMQPLAILWEVFQIPPERLVWPVVPTFHWVLPWLPIPLPTDSEIPNLPLLK